MRTVTNDDTLSTRFIGIHADNETNYEINSANPTPNSFLFLNAFINSKTARILEYCNQLANPNIFFLEYQRYE